MAVREITPKELAVKLREINPPLLVDVRESFEREIASLGGLHIPLGELESRINEIPRDVEIIIYCKMGGRSARAVEALQTHCGYTNLINLKGGILRWIDEVDPSLKKY